MYWGMGDGRLGVVDVRDIADVAIEVLTDEAHAGKTYTLTGPASITLNDVASSIGAALGKDVRYVPVSIEQVEEATRPMMGNWGAKTMGQYSKAYSENWADFTTASVKDITGHEPRSIHDFANEVLAPGARRLTPAPPRSCGMPRNDRHPGALGQLTVVGSPSVFSAGRVR